MKQLIIIVFAALLLISPIAVGSVERDPGNLPVYHGTLKDPGVTVLEVHEDYYIIEVDGYYYILIREK